MQANHMKGMFNTRRMEEFVEFNFGDCHKIHLKLK
jgi:hypothetical protein